MIFFVVSPTWLCTAGLLGPHVTNNAQEARTEMPFEDELSQFQEHFKLITDFAPAVT